MHEERLSMEHIYEKYPDQWLFIVDCEINSMTEPISGIVKLATESREEAYEASANHKGSGMVRYTGEFPEDLMFLF